MGYGTIQCITRDTDTHARAPVVPRGRAPREARARLARALLRVLVVYSHHKNNNFLSGQKMQGLTHFFLQLELPVLNKLLPDHKSSGHMDCIGIGRQHSYFT